MSAAEHPAGPFPDRVGKYELLMPIGTGATATVFLARTRGVAGFEREVALKLVHAHLRGDEESKLHLLDEARLAARIRHPNVVAVTEVDADPFGVFLVMDYVEGETLSGLVRVVRERNQRLPPRLAARIVNDALAGLHAAHELRDADGQLAGLVHRDFSPQNILVGVEGVTRLADFGVAKAASRAVRTKTGLVKGKIAYMSPEQARGHKLDRRCDVWAAGVVVWELIAGRRLYEHDDEVATLLSIVTQEPPRLRDVLRGVPSALEEAVSYALTNDLNGRCPSAEAFRSLLEAAWQDIGGMASAAEVAAFVRATVGVKLSDRRAQASRRNGAGTSGAVPPAKAATANPPITPLPSREEATKTAISAAVPAALGYPKRRRFWQGRSLVIGASFAVLALVTVAVPLALQSNEHAALGQQATPAADLAKEARSSAPVKPALVNESRTGAASAADARFADQEPRAPASSAEPDEAGKGAGEQASKAQGAALDPSTRSARAGARSAQSLKRAAARRAKARRAALAASAAEAEPAASDKKTSTTSKKSATRREPAPLAADPYQTDN